MVSPGDSRTTCRRGVFKLVAVAHDRLQRICFAGTESTKAPFLDLESLARGSLESTPPPPIAAAHFQRLRRTSPNPVPPPSDSTRTPCEDFPTHVNSPHICRPAMILPTAFIERKLQSIFYSLGQLIGRHPWRFIIGPLIFSLLCSAGFVRFKQINNARVQFTASDAPSRFEAETLHRFLNQNGESNVVQVIVDARGQGDLLQSPYKEQLIALTAELSEEVKVEDPARGRNVSFMEMCEPYCRKNDPLITTLKLAHSGRIEMTYPVINLMGTEASIGTSMYKIERDNATGLIIGFKFAILQFFLVHKEVMYAWEDKAMEVIKSNKYNFIRVDMASDNLVGKEVKRMGTETAPMLVLALGALLVFVIGCSFRQRSRESKPFESVIGGVTPIVAGLASIGLVSATGLAFQSIVVATMFLLLAVGVDDVFIMRPRGGARTKALLWRSALRTL
ncbi:hypothetical protein L596_027984 [Steinernema carpocapsae]|uniref:SSD domain-containing protein n=1 Tax=Steinernema carpocapsae TaxID=34508 RepID=A0A4U5LX44_STECR|nr:hypothetical protein L596_027984 [Steinernema carpocapsae]